MRRKTVLCFSTLLLIVAAYTIVKAVRDAVFLSRFGVTEISFIAIGLALLAGFVVGVYQRVTKGRSRARIIGVSHSLIGVTLIVIWLGLSHPATAWALYIWSSLFGVFIVMQLWLLAGDLFSVREAKRAFPVIASGAILGGLSGGLCAQLVAHVGTLLLIATVMLLVAAMLVALVSRDAPSSPELRRDKSEQAPPRLIELLSRPSFVRSIAICLLLSTVATTLLDWQLKAIAKHSFADRTDDMAAFFGSLFAYQSAASLVMQLALTGWLLRRLGIGLGRIALPLVLMLGALAVIGHGVLPWSLLAVAAGAKVAEGSVRFAIDKAVTELTWLPVNKEVRDSSKSFVDTVIDRLGTGLTGLLWLGLAAFGLDDPQRVHLIALVVAGFVGLWLLSARVAQRDYLDAFRQSLAQRTIDLESLRLSLGEAEAQRRLTAALESDDADQARFGLYLLSEAEQLPDLSAPLSHDEATVRLQALELLIDHEDASQQASVTTMLDDIDARVREAAIVYLRRHAPTSASDGDSMESDLIALSDPKRREAAQARIASRIERGDVEQIGLLGAAPPKIAAQLLAPLLDADEPAVVSAALQAAGRARAEDLVPALAAHLDDRHLRPRAAVALREMEAFASIADLIESPAPSQDAKRAMVRLLGACRDRALATRVVSGRLVAVLDGALRGPALASLSRLRAAVGIEVPATTIDKLLREEVEALYRQLLYLGRGGWPLARGEVPADFFERVIFEDAATRLRRLFQLLSLRHDPDDVRSAARAIASPIAATRDSGVEFLDNLLSPGDRQTILPPLEDLKPRGFRAAARKLDIRREGVRDVANRFAASDDWWLRSVACWKMGDDDMSLTLLERALKLRAVDVLKDASSEDLAYVAQIAEEREVSAGTALYAEGDAPDALYVILSGEVDLAQGDDAIGTASEGEAFGSWALVDESPRVASATAKTDATLLTVDRADFQDLLADRPDIVQAVLKAMVKRIRALAELAKVTS